MTHSYDWSVVGYHSHPIPGDPADVAITAKMFARTAGFIEETASGLRRMDTSDTQSDAVTELLSNAREIAGMLEQALDRYVVAGNALAAYAPRLEHARAQAEEALRAAQGARAEHDRASDNATNLWWGAKLSVEPQERTQFLHSYHQAKAQAAEAESAYNAARAKILSAIHDRDAAADQAANAINSSISGRDLNDSFLDKLGAAWEDLKEIVTSGLASLPQVIKDIGNWIWEHLEEISLVLTVLALLLSWVPVVGQITMAIAAVARGLAILAKAADLVVMVREVHDLTLKFREGLTTGNFAPFLASAGLFLVAALAGRKISKGLESSLKRTSKTMFDRAVSEVGFTKAVAAVGRTVDDSAPKKVLTFLGLVEPSRSASAVADELISTLRAHGSPVWKPIQDSLIAAGADEAVGVVKDLVEDVVEEHVAEPAHRFIEQLVPIPAGRS